MARALVALAPLALAGCLTQEVHQVQITEYAGDVDAKLLLSKFGGTLEVQGVALDIPAPLPAGTCVSYAGGRGIVTIGAGICQTTESEAGD